MSVYQAISKVQGELAKTGISKNKTNEAHKYKFRGIDDIYNALSSVMVEAGLCILPRVVERESVERQSFKGGAIFYVTVKVEFDFIYVADPSSKHVVVVYGEAMDSGDKATNKAMSAAYKDACVKVFCIPTEGDNDADSMSHEVVSDVLDKAIDSISQAETKKELKEHYEAAIKMFPDSEDKINKAAKTRQDFLNEQMKGN